jgi:hypothetical protein
MAKYLSLDECPTGGRVELFYTINSKDSFLESERPLLVKTGKITPKVKVFIDSSGSMNDIESDIENKVNNTLIVKPLIFRYNDERWINWLRSSLSEEESLALIFIDESSPYLHPNNWTTDLAEFLVSWNSSPKSYAHVFVINDEVELSSLLIQQVSSAFESLKETGYSFSINNPSSIAFSPGRQVRKGTFVVNLSTANGKAEVKINSPIDNFLKTIKGGYQIEVFSCPSFNVDTMIEMKVADIEIPEWMFRGPVITAKSNKEINVKFNCGEGCPLSAFEIESRYPPGWECFPYADAIEAIEKTNNSLAQILRG